MPARCHVLRHSRSPAPASWLTLVRPALRRILRMSGRLWSARTISVTDEDDDGFAPVAPLNDQLVCGLCEDCTMDAHEDADDQLLSRSKKKIRSRHFRV